MMISVSGNETIVLFSTKKTDFHVAVELADNDRILIHSDTGMLTIVKIGDRFEIIEKKKNQNTSAAR